MRPVLKIISNKNSAKTYHSDNILSIQGEGKDLTKLLNSKLQQNDLEKHANSDSDFQQIKQPKPKLRDLIKLSTLIEIGNRSLGKKWTEGKMEGSNREKIEDYLFTAFGLESAAGLRKRLKSPHQRLKKMNFCRLLVKKAQA